MSVVRPSTVRFLNDLAVPMRDGVRLSADVYLPADMDGSLPALLSRTPYDNANLWDVGAWWAQNGYVYVAQDVRGRFDSGGDFVPWDNETNDGYDTIEWLTQQEWCDGNVGMTGGSYLAQVQYQAVFSQHPALKAICPRVMGNNLWDSPHWQNGAFGLGVNAVWGWRTMGRTTQRIDRFDWPQIMRTLPVAAMEEVSGKQHPAFSTWIDHPDYDEYWKATAVDEHFDAFTIPVLHVCGWYDLYAGGMMINFTGLRQQAGSELARQNQQMIMGPWTHPQAGLTLSPGTTNAGDRDFGLGSLLNTAAIEKSWFDHWLKGIENEAEQAAPVKIYVMGADEWRDEQEWPLERTEWTPWYLHSAGFANSINGDGALSPDLPGESRPNMYAYDPLNPVPTMGGCNCCNPEVVPWGVFDQRSVEFRDDVLIFTSSPLEQDLEVTGPVVVQLWASTDGPDTDFTAKLCDVYPDGRSWNLCDGIVRARYRNGRAPASLVTPGEIYQYSIDCWVTSNVFKAGHQIRIEISSSNFPRFDRNLNTGGVIGRETEVRTAINRVYHDPERPSHVLLPVIPG